MGGKGSPRIAGKTARQGGFTLPELITVLVTVTIVVMHAYDLLPNMKGMFSRFAAIKAAEDLRNMHGVALTLAQSAALSSSTSTYIATLTPPTLLGLVGGAPAKAAPPKEADAYYDWGWLVTSGLPADWEHWTAGDEATITNGFVHGMSVVLNPSAGVARSPDWSINATARMASCHHSDMLKDIHVVPWYSLSAQWTLSDTFLGVPGSAPGPACEIHYKLTAVSNGAVTERVLLGTLGDYPAPPTSVRVNCAPVSAKYGQKYVVYIKTKPSGAWSYAQEGDETGVWWGQNGIELTQFGSTERAWRFIRTGFPDGNLGAGNGPTAVCMAESEPVAVPETLGSVYVAQDKSGYCVADGWKLPTFQDAAGTIPTTDGSNPVLSMAKDPVRDEANCPKGGRIPK